MAVEQWILANGLFAIALVICLGEMGMPVGLPAELIMMAGGALLANSIPELIWVIFLLTVADVVGTTVLHMAVRSGSPWVFRILKRTQDQPGGSLQRWQARLGGREVTVVFVTRSLPMVRMWATIGLAIMQVRLRSFFLGAIPAAIIWTGLPVVAGYILRDNVRALESRYGAATNAVMLAIPVITIALWSAIWTFKGDNRHERIRRGRASLGVTVAAMGVAYMIALVSQNTWLVEYDEIPNPLPELAIRSLAVAGLTLVLLVFTVVDVRWIRRHLHGNSWHMLDLATTLAWVGLIAAVATIAITTGIAPRPPFP